MDNSGLPIAILIWPCHFVKGHSGKLTKPLKTTPVMSLTGAVLVN